MSKIMCDWCGKYFETHSDVKHIFPTKYYSIITYCDNNDNIIRYYLCDSCIMNILEAKP